MESITTPPGREPDHDAVDRAHLAGKVISGAHWFYWIAGLSLINTIISFAGGGWSFGLGLAFTQIIDAVSGEFEGPVRFVVLFVDLICTGIFAMFGLLGSRQQGWAILVGTILYIMDGILFIGLMALGGGMMVIGLLIHVYATYQLIVGYIACRQLANMRYTPGPPGPEIVSTMGQQ